LLTALTEALTAIAGAQRTDSPLPPLADVVHPADAPGRGPNSRGRAGRGPAKPGTLLPLEEVYAELGGIARSTFYDWRAKGKRLGASNCRTGICVSAAPNLTDGSANERTSPDEQ